jgi:beta-lactamase class A
MRPLAAANRPLAAAIRPLAAALVLSIVAVPAHAGAKEDALWSRLRARLETLEHGVDGVVGISVKDLKTGAAIDIRPDETFPQASVIKLAVLYELFRQAEEGRIDLGEITRPPAARVVGGGVLQELGPSVSLTWHDVAVLMMGWSDNAATNVLIERLGMDAVNRRLDALGLAHTRLRRRMMDLEAARRGEENVSTPAEMRRLIETIYAGTGLSPARAADLRKVTATTMKTNFRKPLPEGVVVLDKDGELEAVRAAAAVVDLPGRPYAITIMTTYLRRDADGEALIRDVSAAVFETFDRLARSSELGRIISER